MSLFWCIIANLGTLQVNNSMIRNQNSGPATSTLIFSELLCSSSGGILSLYDIGEPGESK